ncbi:MAG: carboxypeptidase-like regulatory domain-containing protein [Vicinamibacterales bacterium]
MTRLVIIALATLSFAAPSLAQVSGASAVRSSSATPALSGIVTDGDHAVLQSVTVTATDARGHRQLCVTGDDGAFRFQDLPAGTYALEAELPGFRTVTVKGVVLSGTQAESIPLSMTTEPFGVSLMVTGSSGKQQATTARRVPERVATRARR